MPVRLNKRADVMSSAIAVGYVRVSTEEQKLSPQVQRDAIAQWSAYNGIAVLEIFEDLGVSGTLAPSERDGLSRCVRMVIEQRVDFLVVASRDRIAREVAHTAVLSHQLQSLAHKCRIITAFQEATHELTPEEQMQAQMVDVFAEYEVRKIRERTRKGVAKARANGRVPGPRKWESYRRGQLTIQLCKRLREDGLSNAAIVSFCLRHNVLSPHRGRITMAHVRNCLSSSYPAAGPGDSALSLVSEVLNTDFYRSRYVPGDEVQRLRVSTDA